MSDDRRHSEYYAVMSLDPDDKPPHKPLAMFSTLHAALEYQRCFAPKVQRMLLVRKMSISAPSCVDCQAGRKDCGADHKYLVVYWPKREDAQAAA